MQNRTERLALAREAARESSLISGQNPRAEVENFELHAGLMDDVMGCEHGRLTHPLIFNMILCNSRMHTEYRKGIRASVRSIVPEALHVVSILTDWWEKHDEASIEKMLVQPDVDRHVYAWEQHDFLMSLEPFADANGRTARLMYYNLLVALKVPIKVIYSDKAVEYSTNMRRYRETTFVPLMKECGFL